LASATAGATAQQIQATVNGTPVAFSDVQPMMINQRVMVPLRGVFEHMGADVDWNAATQTVSAKTEGKTVVLRIGDRMATVNGNSVEMDTPAMSFRNRTMVPLRFLGESLGAKVAWMEPNTVAITTTDIVNESDEGVLRVMEANTVVPLTLNQDLSSNTAAVGDKFTANLDTRGNSEYQNLPAGTTVEGHVSIARAKTDKAPGVLGLEYDRLVLPNGRTYVLDASPVGLDDKSVIDEDGKLVAKDTKKGKDTLKWVGIGAGGGALVAMLTKGNVITDALIGGALGWLFSELQKNPSQSNNVMLKSGTPIGMRLDQRLTFRDSFR
jgi:hypothetical protein